MGLLVGVILVWIGGIDECPITVGLPFFTIGLFAGVAFRTGGIETNIGDILRTGILGTLNANLDCCCCCCDSMTLFGILFLTPSSGFGERVSSTNKLDDTEDRDDDEPIFDTLLLRL